MTEHQFERAQEIINDLAYIQENLDLLEDPEMQGFEIIHYPDIESKRGQRVELSNVLNRGELQQMHEWILEKLRARIAYLKEEFANI